MQLTMFKQEIPLTKNASFMKNLVFKAELLEHHAPLK